MRRALNLLLLGLPLSIASRFLGGPALLTLAAAALALVPIATWIAEATEHLAKRVGSGMGGFLNASFTNTIELVITILALRRGLTDLAKASIVGSIVCNTLLVLGLSAFAGGIRNGMQKFRPKAAGRHAAMMILAVSAMALPAFAAGSQTPAEREKLSIAVALILLASYAAYLIFSHFSSAARAREMDVPSSPPGRSAWSRSKSILVLGVSLVGAAAASEMLVYSVEPVTRSLGLSETFIGLILIPLLGNIAEQFTSISFARENRLNLSISIAANSSTQIAVFVAPLLVLVSRFFHPLDLVFRPIELISLFGSTSIFAYISLDGESNWLEGAQLIALYLIVAAVFFFLPH